jgi:hypothetical protein
MNKFMGSEALCYHFPDFPRAHRAGAEKTKNNLKNRREYLSNRQQSSILS